jgi:hypothetical protein
VWGCRQSQASKVLSYKPVRAQRCLVEVGTQCHSNCDTACGHDRLCRRGGHGASSIIRLALGHPI